MKIYQMHGYPVTHYFVKTASEWYAICAWMQDNDVRYLQESSGPHGIEFSITKNLEWFQLRWT